MKKLIAPAAVALALAVFAGPAAAQDDGGLDRFVEKLTEKAGKLAEKLQDFEKRFDPDGFDLPSLLEDVQELLGDLGIEELLDDLRGFEMPEMMPDLDELFEQLQEQFGEQFGDGFDLDDMLEQFRDPFGGFDLEQMMERLREMFEEREWDVPDPDRRDCAVILPVCMP